MTNQFDRAAREIATNLDSGKEQEAATQLSQYAQQLSREDYRSLIKAVDANEQDDKGLDLIVKKDAQGTPTSFAILPKELHQSARDMARLMDTGAPKTAAATELLNRTATNIDNANGGDAQKTQQQFSRWAIAVDAYERDGIGSDVTVDLSKPGLTGLSWKFEK